MVRDWEGIFENVVVKNESLKGYIMKTKKFWILVVMLGICAGAALAAIRNAAKPAIKEVVILEMTDPNILENDTYRNMKQQTLTGLNALGLVIKKEHTSFSPVRKTHSIETGALRAMIVKKLKMAGFKLLSPDELLSEPGIPLLEVGIFTSGPTSCTKEGKFIGTNLGYDGLCCVYLFQEQFLARSKDISNYGITWPRAVELKWAKTTDELEESIKEATTTTLNDFIVAHLAANPKEEPKNNK